jgi:hypothetical protein
MMFWDPMTQWTKVFANYKLDPDAAIGTHFPTVIYKGHILISPMVLLRGERSSTKEPFSPGSDIQVKLENKYCMWMVQNAPIKPSIPNYQTT